GLIAGGEGDEQIAGDVFLGEAHLVGHRAIDIHANVGGVDDLLQAEVRGAGDGANISENLSRDLRILIGVGDGAGDLDVDGSVEAEVENLRGDVGRGEVANELREFFGKID